MKRSQFKELILDYLRSTQYLDIPCSAGSDFNNAAEDIVKITEEAGMFPPIVGETYTEPYKVFVSLVVEDGICSGRSYWEDETDN